MTLALKASGQMSYFLGNEAAYIGRQEQEAAAATNDSVKANAYLKLSLLYRRINNAAKSKAALQQGIGLARNYPFLQAASYYYKSLVEYIPGDITALEKKLITSDSLLQLFDEQESYKLRSIIWNNYGVLQQMKGDEKGALDVFVNKAIQHATRSGDLMVLGKGYKGIAIIFMNSNQREKAADYLQKSAAALRRAPLENPINRTELIETYIHAGENFVNLYWYDSARNALNQARQLLAPYPSSNLYVIFYFAEGVYLYKTNQSAQAVISLDKGIDLATKLGAVHSLNRLIYAKYKALSNLKEYKKAVGVLEELVRSPYVFTVDKQLYYKELYTTYAALGNTRDAFQRAQQYITLSDSLHQQQLQKDIAELESKFKHAENERKITMLQAEKERAATESHNNRLLAGLLGALSLFLFVSVVLGVVLHRQRSARYRQQLKDAEQQQQIQLTRALMQGEEKERKRLAADLHDGLGGQLAGIKINLSRLATNASHPDTQLQKVIEQLDVSADELRRIARNMMPESLLIMGLEPALKDMCDSLSTEATPVNFQPFGIQRDIHPEVQINIYRIVQELLTNAVRHARASEIVVQCSQNGARFFITLEDNGKGFDPAAIIARPGIGLSNARNRVEYLNGKLDITSAPGEGTTINIEFDVTTR